MRGKANCNNHHVPNAIFVGQALLYNDWIDPASISCGGVDDWRATRLSSVGVEAYSISIGFGCMVYYRYMRITDN